MLTVGLTGGYATGKTFVAQEFARLGCVVIYADELGHTVLRRTGAAYDSTVALLGTGVLGEDGEIDRSRVAAIVFRDPELLGRLTAIVHPAVFALEERLIREAAAADPHMIAVVEAAILVETGRHTFFDCIVMTHCDPEIQIARGAERSGDSRERVLARISRQLSPESKMHHAHYVINTGGTREDTLKQAQDVYRSLRELERSRT